ncbi:ABC transporter substrate-binding protein [Paucibacter sp. B2R-40]|uniref:ABC transporter substrate-binding protein n=1 Tax=Paucibacter sp. B2R-40 TaxID=2893554 RepID=UPI0021E3823B|nr:ABC transporter substrate-binding protein [Paucibacter sp. B2R-40]MCV2354283.1 ABC transporter substrate-binding protein [Paucibacter sp. B2R-40]
MSLFERRRSLFALAAASLVALANAPANAADAAEPTVLRFAWWGGGARHQATLKAIAAFERQNPGLKIKAEYMGFNGYLERLTTQIAGGSEPDVMQINWAWMAMFSKRGTGFTDLNQYRHVLALNQFSEQDLSMGMVAGKLNALPVGYSARIFLWNKAAFDRAGLPLPKTWDELFAAGAVFKQRLGPKAFPLDGELYDMILLSQAYVHQKLGTAYLDPKQPRVAMSPAAALEWVQTYKRLVDGHTATPLRLRASLGGAEKATEQQQDWVVGNWAGNYTWDSAIALRASTLDAQQKLALGEFPTLPGAANSGMFGRPSLMFAVGRNSKKAELAARFINFLLTDPEAARILGKTRGVPGAQSQFDLLVRENALPPLELQAHAQIQAQKQAGRIELPSPLFEHARMQKFMREVFETVAYGKTTDAEAAKRLVEEGNALLRRIK